MEFSVVDEEILADGCSRIYLRIPPANQVYLGYILESFEGWCFHSIVKKNEPLLKIDISPDYVANVKELLEFLKTWEV